MTLVHTRSSRDTRASDWLAHTHDDPQVPHREWAERAVALLPLGRRFDVVRIPAAVVHAALGTENRDAISRTLGLLLGGPVVQDGQMWTYALVPVGGVASWPAHAGEYLSAGSWPAVPRPDQLGRPGPHWAVAPDTPGRLCDPAAVSQLVAVGAARLSGEGHG